MKKIFEIISLEKYAGIRVFINSKIEDSKCVVFCYANWATFPEEIIPVMNSLLLTPSIPLYIFDIDNSESKEILDNLGCISRGCGEKYWIYENKIENKIMGMLLHAPPMLDEMIRMNIALLNKVEKNEGE